MPEQKEFISIDGIAMSARAIFMPSNNYNGGCFMDSNDLKFVESRIDYKFKNTDLLQQAFIRRSYSKECGGENNEVLEFIGDKVLDMVVVKWLISQNGFFCSQTKEFNRNNDWDEFCSKRDEHQLTQDKKWLVCKETLAERIDIMGLAKFLIMGKGDSKNNIQNQPSVKEDLFEAILGAVALDSKWDMKVLENTVDIMLDPYSTLYDVRDYYSEILKFSGELPDLRYSHETYCRADGIGGMQIRVTCFLKLYYTVKSLYSTNSYSRQLKQISGQGNTKSVARREACKKAYEFLKEHNLLPTIKDEIDAPDINKAINQLEILARRGYFSLPEYKFSNEHDDNGNPTWKCECHIDEADYYYWSTQSTKKAAKKQAAFDMLNYVLEHF